MPPTCDCGVTHQAYNDTHRPFGRRCPSLQRSLFCAGASVESSWSLGGDADGDESCWLRPTSPVDVRLSSPVSLWLVDEEASMSVTVIMLRWPVVASEKLDFCSRGGRCERDPSSLCRCRPWIHSCSRSHRGVERCADSTNWHVERLLLLTQPTSSACTDLTCCDTIPVHTAEDWTFPILRATQDIIKTVNSASLPRTRNGLIELQLHEETAAFPLNLRTTRNFNSTT